ncbi:MAG: gliding motility-associated C-terminal domain-containing protein, partial [Bacteroidales bacterium]|nr:gliding motility-associated C-terminal domain-containing protein [Bacteroidales bacterium]
IRLIIAALAACLYLPAAHAQITADFTATPETACTGSIVTITVNNNSSDYKTAQVEFGDGIDTYGNDLKHIYMSAGTFNISLRLLLNDNTWTAKQTKSVTIGDTPELTLEDNPAAALITATVSSGASLTWSRNDVALSITTSTLYYMESGTYSVTATNDNGCSVTESVKVKYEKEAENDDTQIRVANNVITPGIRDGINDVLVIEDVDNYTAPCSVQIFDKRGKLVYTNHKYTNTDGFQGLDDDGNELFVGTYYYVIKSQGKKGCTGFVDLIR